MKQKNTIFNFLNQVFVIFGCTVLCLMVFVSLLGEEAKGVSAIFQLGSEGIAVSTLCQYLLLAVIITSLQWLFFTDCFIKKASITIRIVSMFVSVVLVIAVLAVVFGWFPVYMWQAWLGFFICFAISTAISTAVSLLKERIDNAKLQEALERFNEGEKS